MAFSVDPVPMPDSHGMPEKIRETLRRLKPFIGSQAQDVYQAYLIEDSDGKDQIENYLEALLGQYSQFDLDSEQGDLVPPEAAASDGSYKMGTVIYEGKEIGPFGLRESEWIQHVGIFGRSGAGKTNMGFLTLKALKDHSKPFLVFDWKRNYRDLAALPGFEDIEIYTVGRPIAPLAYNPLIPPQGTAPKTWLKKIIEVIAHAYMLGDGVLYLLQQTLDAVYERFGVYSGEVQRYPTFRDVLDEVKRYPAKGREAGWLSSTLRALSTLCFGDMDMVVNSGQNQNLQALLEQNTILELDALAQTDKTFFIQALLLWIHHYRMAEREREEFKHVILIEEAHHVLSGERRSLVGGQSVMEITFREIREFGESLIILDQHPSQIALAALGNTYTTVCLNLKHAKDVNAMGQAMLLDSKDKDILGSLEVGQAVVKLQGRTARPFMIKIPEFNIAKGQITDCLVAARKRTLSPPPGDSCPEPGLATPFAIPRHDAVHPLLSYPNETADSKSSISLLHQVLSPTEGTKAKLQTLEFRFLLGIQESPESGIAARYKNLNISVRQGQKIKQRALDQNLVSESLESTRTGTVRVVRLTKQGERILQENQDPT